MEIFHKEINTVWLKASVVGSLWGSIEIIVGSFFHNVRLPLAGTVLAILGIVIICAFGQIWKVKGLFWRAGLICAIMKSVSPSAVLLGPMTGIFVEAMLFELSVLLFGYNYLGYIIGGIAALYSVILHKVIALLIIYGFNLIKITENLYYYIVKQLNIQDVSFLHAFLLISSFYVLFGIFASLTGIVLGKKAYLHKHVESGDYDLLFEKKYDFVQPIEKHNSLFILFLHLFLILVLLSIVNFASLYLSISMIAIYTVITIIHYGKSMRYVKKIGFWAQILFFVLISVFFYNGFNPTGFFVSEGIESGIKMGLRAVMIVIAFSAVSTELRNPVIKALLFRKGFWQLYTALGLAFSVLPYLSEKLPRPKDLIKHPIRSLNYFLVESQTIYKKFKALMNRSKIYTVSGNIHQGKTKYTLQLIRILRDKDISVKGFTAVGNFKDNERTQYSIKDIQTEKEELLCTSKGKIQSKRIERFIFHETGLEYGKLILDTEHIKTEEIIVIDEIGPYELNGKGWTDSIEKILNKGDYMMIWVVRESLIFDIFRKFCITDGILFDISKDKVEDAAEIIFNDFKSIKN